MRDDLLVGRHDRLPGLQRFSNPFFGRRSAANHLHEHIDIFREGRFDRFAPANRRVDPVDTLTVDAAIHDHRQAKFGRGELLQQSYDGPPYRSEPRNRDSRRLAALPHTSPPSKKNPPAWKPAGWFYAILFLISQAAIARTPPARDVRVMRIRMRIEHVAVIRGRIESKP